MSLPDEESSKRRRLSDSPPAGGDIQAATIRGILHGQSSGLGSLGAFQVASAASASPTRGPEPATLNQRQNLLSQSLHQGSASGQQRQQSLPAFNNLARGSTNDYLQSLAAAGMLGGPGVHQGLQHLNPQLLQMQQLGLAPAPMNSSISQALIAALGLTNPSGGAQRVGYPYDQGSSGFGLEVRLAGLQQPTAGASATDRYMQQLLARGASASPGGLGNHNLNALLGLSGPVDASSSRDQLLQLIASAVGPGGLAPGGNPTAAALLSQLGSPHLSPNGTPAAARNDPPGSTVGVDSVKRPRDALDGKDSKAAAMPEQPLVPSPGLMGRPPVKLYMSCDDERLSSYHALARKHIEFFEAAHDDISTNARGRNRPIVLGQVGIRCHHCSHLPPRRRARAAMYYPFKLDLLYQACQTLANVHLCEQCQHMPSDVRAELVKLRGEKTTALVGKKYWADGARIHDVYESPDGLRFKPKEEEERGTTDGAAAGVKNEN